VGAKSRLRLCLVSCKQTHLKGRNIDNLIINNHTFKRYCSLISPELFHPRLWFIIIVVVAQFTYSGEAHANRNG